MCSICDLCTRPCLLDPFIPHLMNGMDWMWPQRFFVYTKQNNYVHKYILSRARMCYKLCIFAIIIINKWFICLGRLWSGCCRGGVSVRTPWSSLGERPDISYWTEGKIINKYIMSTRIANCGLLLILCYWVSVSW